MARGQSNNNNNERQQPIQRATIFLEVYPPREYADRATGEVKVAAASFRMSGVVGSADDADKTNLPDLRARTAEELHEFVGTFAGKAISELDKALVRHLRGGG